MFYWIDSIVGQIQYGKRTQLCDSIKNKTAEQQHAFFIQNAKDNNDCY
jgi:hypothetical protein